MPWGDDVILTDKRYFLPFLARAMTYVDVNSLTRDELFNVVGAFPVSYRQLRRATIKLSLRRHLIEAARWVNNSGGDKDAAMAGDFVDQVHEAAGTGLTKAQQRSVNMAVELENKAREGGRSSLRRSNSSISPTTKLTGRADGDGGDDGDDEGLTVDGEALNEFMQAQEAGLSQLKEEMRSLHKLVAKLVTNAPSAAPGHA